MKTTIFKRLVALAACTGMVGVTALAAGTVYKTITVKYDDIQIVLNGEKIEPKDADGQTVEPFIYEGTTYLPVRAIGEALNLEVAWDEASKTVTLDGDSVQPDEPESTGEPGWLLDVCPVVSVADGVMMPTSFQMGNATYEHGIVFTRSGQWIKLDLSGKYKTLTLDFGPIGIPYSEANLTIVRDGTYGEEFLYHFDDPVKHVEVSVEGVDELMLQLFKYADLRWGDTQYGLGNCKVS